MLSYGGNVAFLELPDAGPRFYDAADNLVPGHAGINGRHHALPLIAHLV
jgi:hypothetical protein